MGPIDRRLAFLFLEVTDLAAARDLCEGVFGLPVIENRFHPPHHHHGIVKYDAGGLILSLNLARPGSPAVPRPSGLTTVLASGGVGPMEAADLRGLASSRDSSGITIFFDRHIFRLTADREAPEGASRIEEIRLEADDVPAVAEFYASRLGLEEAGTGPGSRRFRVGGVDIVLTASSGAGGAGPSPRQGYLLVFATTGLDALMGDIADRGVEFTHPAGRSAIGRTVRFVDPAGHPYCLYEPSEEALSWESGPKVRSILRMV